MNRKSKGWFLGQGERKVWGGGRGDYSEGQCIVKIEQKSQKVYKGKGGPSEDLLFQNYP